MEYPILVTAAIIEDKGKFLITQRPDDGRHKAGKWEFPGGKVEFGETPRNCLKREINEELGIDIEVGKVFECSSHVYENKKHVILLAFRCKHLSGNIKNIDIQNHEWSTPDKLADYDLCEADIVFVKKLIHQ